MLSVAGTYCLVLSNKSRRHIGRLFSACLPRVRALLCCLLCLVHPALYPDRRMNATLQSTADCALSLLFATARLTKANTDHVWVISSESFTCGHFILVPLRWLRDDMGELRMGRLLSRLFCVSSIYVFSLILTDHRCKNVTFLWSHVPYIISTRKLCGLSTLRLWILKLCSAQPI